MGAPVLKKCKTYCFISNSFKIELPMVSTTLFILIPITILPPAGITQKWNPTKMKSKYNGIQKPVGSYMEGEEEHFNSRGAPAY